MSKNAVVVGGGIVGIASALLLKEKFENVFLVEKAKDIGGLLNSLEHENSYYDFGTHIPALTGHTKLDEVLFDLKEDFPGWNNIPYLKVANYFNGQWNSESPLVDIRSLENYPEALEEFLRLPEADMNEEVLGNFIEKYFGQIIADDVYRPIFKKLHGEDISNLAQKILYNFCLHRVIALDSPTTKELKKLPKFDSKLGFHSYTDVPENNYRYPLSEKGCGEWITALKAKLIKKGVTIVTDAEVSAIATTNDQITSLTIKGEEIKCDFCAWTIPPIFLQKLTNSFVPGGEKPTLRVATLLNLELDKPIIRDNHYVFIWDPEISIFRMTFYKNLREGKEKKNLLSIEFLSDQVIPEEGIIEKALDELQKMELIEGGTKVVNSQYLNLGPVFPVITPKFVEHSAKTKDFLEDKFNNLKILGKSGGKNFLLGNLLIDAYNEIDTL